MMTVQKRKKKTIEENVFKKPETAIITPEENSDTTDNPKTTENITTAEITKPKINMKKDY